MKVLIIHQHFKTPETGGALRSFYLATALAQSGIQTAVITAHNKKSYQNVNVGGVDVHYLPVPYENRFGFLARTISFLKFAWSSAAVGRRISGTSICYAISTPLTVGLTAIWLKKRSGIGFIFEVGDLWPDAPIQMGFISNSLLRYVLYASERWIYRQSKSIVVLSPSIQSAVENKAPGKPTHRIPNMADIGFFGSAKKTKGPFVISYCGAAGIANGLEYFIDMANESQVAGLPIQFILCGEGATLDELKARAARLALTNLEFKGFRNREGVREVLRLSDAVFVGYKNVPILETGCPNKYFDGLAAGKLIIVNFGGWIREEIESRGCGIHVDPLNASDLVAKISPFLKDSTLLDKFQQSSSDLAQDYSREKVSKDFVQLFTAPA